MMSLSTLPVVVLDMLLIKLDLASLVALSSTCRTLHTESNRVLYREPAFRWLGCYSHVHFHINHCLTERVERTLSRNPSLAQCLRRHRSIDAKLLQAIWSPSPLRLTQLHIACEWFVSSCEQEVEECVNSKHKDLVLREIFIEGPEDGRYRGFLGMLHTFHGLKILNIQHLPSNGFDISSDAMIAQLNCPRLEQLHLSSSDPVPSLGDNLPKLKVLTIFNDFYHLHKPRYSSADDKWARLQALMSREIHFAVIVGILPCLGGVALLPFVLGYADLHRLEPTPIAKWLLTGERFLQNNGELTISGLPPRHRNITLKILKSLNFEEDFRLAVTLHASDTPTLADVLPKTISYLDISVPEDVRVAPAVIPELVRSLPKLRTISIHLEGQSIGIGRCNANCFAASWEGKFPDVPMDEGLEECDYIEYKLIVKRYMKSVWTVVAEGDGIHRDLSRNELPDVESEVLDWLSVNPELGMAEVTFWFRCSDSGESDEDLD